MQCLGCVFHFQLHLQNHNSYIAVSASTPEEMSSFRSVVDVRGPLETLSRRWDSLDHDAVASMLHPMSVDTFIAEHWEKHWLHIRRGDTKWYQGLFQLDDIDYILRSDPRHLGSSAGIFKTDASRSPMQAQGAPPVVQSAAHPDASPTPGSKMFHEAFRDGRSFKVNGLERFWRPVGSLHWNVQSMWNYGVTSTLIASGPGGAALAPHFDFDEVFALQIFGKKTWYLAFPGPFPAPNYQDKHVGGDNTGEWLPPGHLQRLINRTVQERAGMQATRGRTGAAKRFIQVVLEPGDLLYLPRGTVHYTKARGDEGSAHITLGVDAGALAWGWGGLAQAALETAVQGALVHGPSRGFTPEHIGIAREALERHLFHASLTWPPGGQAREADSGKRSWLQQRALKLREGLPPGWLHNEGAIASSELAQGRFAEAVAVFGHLQQSGDSEEAGGALQLVQKRLGVVSLRDVLHQLGTRFIGTQAPMPWGRGFRPAKLLQSRARLVRRHRWAVARVCPGKGSNVVLEYDGEVHRFPAIYRAPLQLAIRRAVLQVNELHGLEQQDQLELAETLIRVGLFSHAPM